MKNPIVCPFSPPSPLSSSCWLFCPLGAQHKFALQGPPGYPLTHRGGAAELTTYKDHQMVTTGQGYLLAGCGLVMMAPASMLLLPRLLNNTSRLCLLGLSWCSTMYNLNKAKRLRMVIRINDSHCNHCQPRQLKIELNNLIKGSQSSGHQTTLFDPRF